MKFLPIYLFSMLFLLPFYGYSHEEPAKTSKEKAEKEAKRKQIEASKIAVATSWKYEVKEGIVNKESSTKYLETLYSQNGTINAMKLYKANGKIDMSVFYTYDEFFNMKTEMDRDSMGNLQENIEFFYDKNHCITKQINYMGETWDSDFNYKRNENNNTITLIKTIDKELVDYEIMYRFDSKIDLGNTIEIIKQKEDDTQQMRVENVFDSENHRTHKKIFDAENDLMYYFTYTYEPNGDFKTISRFTSDNQLHNKLVYQYDANQQLKSITTYNTENQIISYLEYTYQNY